MTFDPSTLTYGADSIGLVCGFLFSPDQPGRPIAADEAVDWLERTSDSVSYDADEDFLWLHFHLAHSASQRWMEAHLDLPESFFEALREGSHSTRIEQQDGALVAVMNDVMFNFEQMPTEIATLWVYTHRRIMITARLKPLRSVDSLRESVRSGEVFRSPTDLLVHLLRDQADLMVQIVRRANIGSCRNA
jgi:zinc transporter